MERNRISDNVIRRLPRYIRCLDTLIDLGVERASSAEISRQMGITASQVRQDLNCFGAFGQPGYGYNTMWLRGQIAQILGTQETHSAIIIGAGNLGHALMENFKFEECGFQLKAAFDVSSKLVGTSLSGTPVYHVDEVETYIKANAIDAAILTLPADYAAGMARRVADAGVKGIWNFTNRDLSSISTAVVENVHFSDSLLSLCYYLSAGSV